MSLTGNADIVNNAGLFDAIGTSQFGAGADIFNNTGIGQFDQRRGDLRRARDVQQ